MSLISLRDKTINAKIVYYGTALSGKTTSLKHVHRVIDPESRIELVSLNTEGDRTLFFDFLPIPLGTISGFQVKLQAFTVPGQVKYNLTRRYVLRGADGVIFVADSRPDAFEDNIKSLVSLRDNLEANGIDPESIPLLIQYNKRDVPNAVPVDRMRAALNRANVPDIESTATSGEGVFEGFASLCSIMMHKIAREYRIGTADEIRDQLEERLAAIARAWRGPRAGTSSQPVPPPPPLDDDAGWMTAEIVDPYDASGPSESVIEVADTSSPDGQQHDVEQILEQAVESNIESARLLAELRETKRRLGDHVRQLAALHETGVVISSELNGDRLLTRVLDSALRTVGSSLGSVLLLTEAGDALHEKLVHGFSIDPIARGGSTEPAVLERVLARRPFILDEEHDSDVLVPVREGTEAPSVALVAPLVHQGEVLGALAVYFAERPLEEDLRIRLRFLAAVGAQAAVALENSRLYARVETFNRELERMVGERTRELEHACQELKVLDGLKDDFLASMSHELLTPLTSISSFAEILATVSGDEGPAAAAERAEFATIVHREATRLSDMLQALLDLSRLEAGKVKLAEAEVDLREGLLASYKRTRTAFKDKDMKVRMRVVENMPAAIGDARWLGRVFDALLSNAAKFSPEGTEVNVTVRLDGDFARVEVRDHGPGVAEHLRACVFERFKQLGDVLTDKPPGLGLGLPMARAILERQGGAIWYEPAESGGSVFAFSVPLASQPALRRAR